MRTHRRYGYRAPRGSSRSDWQQPCTLAARDGGTLLQGGVGRSSESARGTAGRQHGIRWRILSARRQRDLPERLADRRTASPRIANSIVTRGFSLGYRTLAPWCATGPPEEWNKINSYRRRNPPYQESKMSRCKHLSLTFSAPRRLVLINRNRW